MPLQLLVLYTLGTGRYNVREVGVNVERVLSEEVHSEILVKTQGTHFNPLLLLDPLLIQVLNIVVD